MDEFQLIRRYFQTDCPGPGVVLGVGDDAAVLELAAGERLVASVDTLVSDVHFPADAPPASIGHKALAVNLSDLAAMGARPAWLLLALTLPEIREPWLVAFSQGLADLGRAHGMTLVGGDTTRGPLTITVQALGRLQGEPLRRDAARAGDRVLVSGTLGDAGGGLQLWQQGCRPNAPSARYLVERLHRPVPQVALGMALRGIVRAAIDVSDGLAADLGHVCRASGAGAVLERERLPLSGELVEQLGEDTARRLALSHGDDYELCVTVAPAAVATARQAAAGLGVRLTEVGRIEAGEGVRVVDAAGQPTDAGGGYRHFAS